MGCKQTCTHTLPGEDTTVICTFKYVCEKVCAWIYAIASTPIFVDKEDIIFEDYSLP